LLLVFFNFFLCFFFLCVHRKGNRGARNRERKNSNYTNNVQTYIFKHILITHLFDIIG
jgi:hypothetical protein